jgi:hypothetical protein
MSSCPYEAAACIGVYVNSSGALGDVAGRDRIRVHDVNYKMIPALLFN